MPYNKYRNKKTPYNGNLYDSKMEAQYAFDLDLQMRAGQIKFWISQVKIPIVINDHKICSYILDFKITHNDNSIEFIEIKGKETSTWRLKKKLFIATYLKENPDTKYLIVYKNKEIRVR